MFVSFFSSHCVHYFTIVKIGDLGVAKLLETSTAFAQTIVGILKFCFNFVLVYVYF